MDFVFELPVDNIEQRKAYFALCRIFQGKVFAREAIKSSQLWQASLQNPYGVGRTLFGINQENPYAQFFTQTDASYEEYDLLNDDADPSLNLLTLEQVSERLRGNKYFVHLDHAGINVARGTTNEQWLSLINSLTYARQSGLHVYPYPEGVDGYDSREKLWYFVLPKEFAKNARNIDAGKPEPISKFKFTHDGLSNRSLVQFDIKTNLTAKGAKQVFPEGFQIPGLEDYFYSINVRTPWDGMRTIRLDLRFKDSARDLPCSELKSERINFESGRFFTHGPLRPDGSRMSPVPFLTDMNGRLYGDIEPARIPKWKQATPHV